MTRLTLYEIAHEHKALAEQLMDLDLDEQTIQDTLEAESDLISKAQSYGFVIRNLEAHQAATAAEAERLALRAKQARNRIDAIKQRLLDAMVLTGTQKIEHPQFTISVAKNPASVVIFDERQVPDAYLTDPKPPAPKPDKRLIKKAIEEGYEVPGAKLVQGVSLRIR